MRFHSKLVSIGVFGENKQTSKNKQKPLCFKKLDPADNAQDPLAKEGPGRRKTDEKMKHGHEALS